jgi:hypothetical protein
MKKLVRFYCVRHHRKGCTQRSKFCFECVEIMTTLDLIDDRRLFFVRTPETFITVIMVFVDEIANRACFWVSKVPFVVALPHIIRIGFARNKRRKRWDDTGAHKRCRFDQPDKFKTHMCFQKFESRWNGVNNSAILFIPRIYNGCRRHDEKMGKQNTRAHRSHGLPTFRRT